MWKVKFNSHAERTIKALEHQTKRRLESFFDDLMIHDNPREIGKALSGDLKGLWRYRVGDYRVICQIKDSELVILIVELGHRKDVYKKAG
jgi:mRNA interferase RelE/StbE